MEDADAKIGHNFERDFNLDLKALRSCSLAMSSDESRYYICGTSHRSDGETRNYLVRK